MRRLSLIAFATLLAAACSGPRQPPPWMRSADGKPRDENYHGGNAAMILKYDANHDGVLTRGELIAGLKAAFAARDTHHNGCLDADQALAINQERVDEDQSTATPVVDWNQDGCIDYTEYSAAPYSLFDQLDLDHDGKLTAKELERAGAKPKDDANTTPADQPSTDTGGHRRRRDEDGGGPPNGEQPPQ